MNNSNTSGPGDFFAGVDVGSCTTKLILLNDASEIVSSRVIYSGTDFVASSEQVWDEALQEAGITGELVKGVVSTGYGRKSVPYAKRSLTEISCHARGCLYYFAGPLTIIDIGGQDNKVIKLDEQGKRQSFKMNRKCAAGTGAFLEEMALRLRLSIGDLEKMAGAATDEVALGSYCTVFSATEVLEKIKAGHKVENIVKGLFRSVIKRLIEMDTLTGTIVLTGGVAQYNPYIAVMLKDHVTGEVKIPPNPQVMGALGAALYAKEDYGQIKSEEVN